MPRSLAAGCLIALLLIGTGPAAAQDGASAATLTEIELWRSVRDSRSPEELRVYLERYPAGEFAPLARIRLKDLESARSAAEPSRGRDTGPPPATAAAQAGPARASPAGPERGRTTMEAASAAGPVPAPRMTKPPVRPARAPAGEEPSPFANAFGRAQDKR